MIPVGTSTYILDNYDPEKIPPDWQAADRHSQACRPGFLKQDSTERLLCPCCMNDVNKTGVSYSDDVKQLAFLGTGFPLFYNYVKFCVMMLAALLADSCILSTYLNIKQNECVSGTNPYCRQGIANSLSYINPENVSTTRIIVNCISFVVQLSLLILMRQTQNSLTIYYDERTSRISDFTLKIKNLPRGFMNNKERITKLIMTKCPQVNIESILLVNRSQEFEEKLRRLRSVSKSRHSKFLDEQQNIQSRILTAHYEHAAFEIAETVKKIEMDQTNYFTGIAFLTFRTKLERDQSIIAINSLTASEISVAYHLKDIHSQKKVRAIKAREPAQIIWENIQKPKKQRTFALIFGWFLTVVFILLLTILFFFMIRGRSHFIEDAVAQDKSIHDFGIFLAYFTIALIVLANKFLLPPICHMLTHLEKHTNHNQSEFSFALKYTLSAFFTTALMTLIVEAIVSKNYYSNFGVVESESYVFMLNGFIPPIVWIVNPYYIVSKLKQKKHRGNEYMTQKEANELMEYPVYSMGKRYADIIKTMWFTFLYVGIIPLGAAPSMLGLICYFFIDKFVLLRRSSVKSSVSSNLANYMMFLLDFTIIFKPLGEIFFDYNIRHDMQPTTYAMTAIAAIYLLLPVNRIFNKLFPEKLLKHAYTYDEVKDSFLVTYHNSYPMNRAKRTVLLENILLSKIFSLPV